MTTQSRRMATAALLAAMALGGMAFGGMAALAGEGGSGQASTQRAKLKAEWAAARARNADSTEHSFVERLFGLDEKEPTVAAAPAPSRKQKKN